jgi:hypothetical protein
MNGGISGFDTAHRPERLKPARAFVSTFEDTTENNAVYFCLIGGAVFSAGAGGRAG